MFQFADCAPVARLLGLAPDARAFVRQRLLSEHGEPVELASTWLLLELAAGTDLTSPGLLSESIRHHLQARKKIPHILAAGVLARTVACPVPPGARPRLRGARPGTGQPPRLPEPLVVARRVSVRGAIMIGGQKIQVGLAHARKTVEVTVGADTYEITVEPGTTVTAPRTSSRHPTAQSLELRMTDFVHVM